MDLAVKWRFAKHLSGGDDPDSERVYRWHIERRIASRMEAGLPTDQWKMKLDDYVSSARHLHESMRIKGFLKTFPVPIDPNGELLGGAHRVATALALDIKFIFVCLRPEYVWAPDWSYLWFIEMGMPELDKRRLILDWRRLTNSN